MSDTMTLTEWHAELQRIAKQHDWPVCADPEEYRDAFDDDMSPADYLAMDMSYGPNNGIYSGKGVACT